MNRIERQTRMLGLLMNYGFTYGQADELRRIEQTLHTWAEHECNGVIQRDEDTGIPYWHSPSSGDRLGATSDREGGALRRAANIVASRNGVRRPDLAAGELMPLNIFHQGDPRGCSLYLYRDCDLDGMDVDCCYDSRGTHCCGR